MQKPKAEPEEFMYKPLGDKVLMRRVEKPKVSDVIEESQHYEKKSNRCIVLSISKKVEAMGDLKVGAYVVCTDYGTEDIDLDGETYALAHYSEIHVAKLR
jgi:co-chaperonin GroES (HSP10)